MIEDDIKIIDRGLAWLKNNKPEQYDQSFFTIVNGRRRLYRQLRARVENPAIGAFGESQTGKSYQINTLLNRTDKPFKIKSTSHPDGVGFVDEINPIGDDREATGVVTRFTSFTQHPERYNKDYPVIVKLLRPGQIAAILSSGYYSNIRDCQTYSDERLRQISENIKKEYAQRPELEASALTEDDILDVKDYLNNYINSAQSICRSRYFESVARVIRRVPSQEWVSVLKYLWYENEAISKLFVRLVADLQRLQYADEVYVPIETVIHGGENRRTIMSVACLNGLDEENWELKTDVYKPSGENKELVKVAHMPTCDLCAISAEVVFRIDPEYLEEELAYCYDKNHDGEAGYMPGESYSKLSTKVDKQFLKDTDLLDFPGARSPEQQDADSCREGRQDENGQSVLVKVYLRGKIAYLFNYYSESHMMKVLLFCHHHKQTEVNNLHSLLKEWVHKNVGETAADRQATLSRTGGISPLMLVATKINIDMTYRDMPSFNTETALNNRWEGRFLTVLLDSVLNWKNVDWFKNWNGSGVQFKGTYLLRSYAYSACTPQGNGMYDGYNVEIASPERELKMKKDFYHLLRYTFINNSSVRELFSDPELAWDVAATMNNDGSLYIIDRMAKVAEASSVIRQEQMQKERDKIMKEVRGILEQEYDSGNEAEKLMANINTVYRLRFEFDAISNNDNYYFGHLLQAMQLTEVECLEIVHKWIQNPDMNAKINGIRQYQLIRDRCDDFAGCETIDDKWKKLMAAYRWQTKEEAQESLNRWNIDVTLLFADRLRPKTNQNYLADRVMELWRGKLRSEELMNTFTGEDTFNPVLMKDLIDTLIDSADRLGLSDYLAKEIKDEVSIADVAKIKESMVADMMATIIDTFVNDFGYSLLSDEQKENAREIVRENDLPVYEYIEKQRRSTYTHDELAALFAHAVDEHDLLPESIKNNYNKWFEYMTMAFIVHLKQSKVRPEVNKALGDIINEINFN